MLDGKPLTENNVKIVKLINLLRNQRTEMEYLIERQIAERNAIRNEIERLTFKLTLLTKGLEQRQLLVQNYEKIIITMEHQYTNLVEESVQLLSNVSKETDLLENVMDKGCGTDPLQPTSPDNTEDGVSVADGDNESTKSIMGTQMSVEKEEPENDIETEKSSGDVKELSESSTESEETDDEDTDDSYNFEKLIEKEPVEEVEEEKAVRDVENIPITEIK